LISSLFDRINTNKAIFLGYPLSLGALGFAYTANHLAKRGFIELEIDSDLTELENYIYESALKDFEADRIDYLHGSLGIFFYFLTKEMKKKY